MTHITTEVDEYPLIRLANHAGLQDINIISSVTIHSPSSFLVFLNGMSHNNVAFMIIKFIMC